MYLEKNRDTLKLIVISLAVFFSRFFFLDAGFGFDADGWRIVKTAKIFAETGEYLISRYPGFPVPELFFSLIPSNNALILNSVSAILSVIAFYIFTLLLKKIGIKNYLLGGLAFVFTSVIYINSTTTMDYIWALCFIIISLYLIFDKKYLLGGLFLGLAIGSRLTSSAMLIPLSLIIIYVENKAAYKSIIKFIVSSLLIGLISFSPVILNYGFSSFTFDYWEYTSLIVVAYRASIGVWGVIGLMGIIISIYYLISNLRILKDISYQRDRILLYAFVSAIIIYLIFFLILPYESGYLIPIVPFVILLLSKLLPNKIFITVCILIIISPFVLTINRDVILIKGPIFYDHSKRQTQCEYVDKIVKKGNSLTEESVIVTGPKFPMIELNQNLNDNSLAQYVYLLNKEQINEYKNKGYKIYFLSEEREYNLKVEGIDLSEHGKSFLQK